VAPVEELVLEAVCQQRVAVQQEVTRHTEGAKDVDKLRVEPFPQVVLELVRVCDLEEAIVKILPRHGCVTAGRHVG